MLRYTEKPGGVTFSARIQPRAAKNQISGVHDGALKIRITAPPVEGAANEACIGIVAQVLGVPRSRVAIIGGATSRNKMLHVNGIDAAHLLATLKNSGAV